MTQRTFWFGEFEWDVLDAEHDVKTSPLEARIDNEIILSTGRDGIAVSEGKTPYIVIHPDFTIDVKHRPVMMKLTYKSGLYEDHYAPLKLFMDLGKGRTLRLLFVWSKVLKLHVKYQTLDFNSGIKQTKLTARLTEGMNRGEGNAQDERE